MHREGGARVAVGVLVCAWGVFAGTAKSTRFRQFTSAQAVSDSSKTDQQESAQARMERESARFITELKAQFELPANADLRAVETLEMAGLVCRRFLETLGKKDVVGASARICFDRTGGRQWTDATLCDKECLASPDAPGISSSEALREAEEQLRRVVGGRFRKIAHGSRQLSPVWLEEDSGGHLVGGYVARFDEERLVAYVDGRDGRLVAYEDRVLFERDSKDFEARDSGEFESRGKTFVYPRDPFTTPWLVPAELFGLDSLDRLASETYLFSIENEDGPPVSKPDGDYTFKTDEPQFDEVQVYSGLQFALWHFLEWGYQPSRGIPVFVHYGTNYANAFYDGEKIALGDGDGKVIADTAKDNTVVSHEYGHFIVDQLAHVKIMPWFGEGGALHEGHADYFACTIYDHPVILDGTALDKSIIRRCDLDLPYSDRKKEVHEAGQVWSGALWEARGRLGKEVVDLLSIHLLPRMQPTGFMGTTLFKDAYKGLIAADAAIYDGKHSDTLKEIFERRGFSQ